MLLEAEAVYEDGVLELDGALPLDEHERVRVRIQCRTGQMSQEEWREERQHSTFQREQNEDLRERLDKVSNALPEPLSKVRVQEAATETARQRFDNLVAVWKSDRGHSSILTELVTHPAYQQIIGMGEHAVPLLLEEMQQRRDHWDWALRSITGTDPVPRESWGKLRDIAAAWVAWGKERGYIKRPSISRTFQTCGRALFARPVLHSLTKTASRTHVARAASGGRPR